VDRRCLSHCCVPAQQERDLERAGCAFRAECRGIRFDDRILGFAMIGAEAGEVMAAVQTTMLASLPYPRLRDAVLTHPTMAEGLGSLLAAVPRLPTLQARTLSLGGQVDVRER
jgi:hypothetical protein